MNERLLLGLGIVFCLVLLVLFGSQAYGGLVLQHVQPPVRASRFVEGREAVNLGLQGAFVCLLAIGGIVLCIRTWKNLDF